MPNSDAAIALEGSQKPQSNEELQSCQSKLGELCWSAAVSRPDICARLARFLANLNDLQVINIYRIDALIKIEKRWQSGRALKYHAGLPRPARCALSCPDDGWGKPRPIHEGTMMLVGWSDAAFGTHAQDGRCRLGYIIGLMASALAGQVHILQWTSKFTRKHVRGFLGCGIFALSEMWGHVGVISEFFLTLGREEIRSYKLIDCESSLPYLRTWCLGAANFLTRHFRSISDALASGGIGNVAWAPGAENSADGLTKVTSETGPLLIPLETGAYRPGRLKQLRDVPFLEKLS